MKFAISSLIFLLLFSATSFANISVERADSITCLAKPIPKRIFTRGKVEFLPNSDSQNTYTIDADMVLNDITSEIRNLIIDLEIAKDPITKLNHVICVSLYDDNRGANASAFGSHHISFGIRLLVDMSSGFKLNYYGNKKLSYYDSFYPVFFHELAHTIQSLKSQKHTYSFPLTHIASKRQELQADCMAGIMLYRKHQGSTQAISNYLSALTVFSHLADNTEIGDHGTELQRHQAYSSGSIQVPPHQLINRSNWLTSDDLLQLCSVAKMDKIIFSSPN